MNENNSSLILINPEDCSTKSSYSPNIYKNSNMNSITILLSAYNGSKYIREQLDSLFAQVKVKISIIIRDDGSTDDTKTIIKEYQSKMPDIITLIEGENQGWIKSFFSLIEYAAYNTNTNYYAFCDQDDIWLPEKLQQAISHLSSNTPSLYASNLLYYKNGKIFDKIRTKEAKSTYKSCLIRNYATGCTVTYNRQLLLLLANQLPSIAIAHDYWAYMVAKLCGEVYIDKEAYILYRQHENNQIGSKSGFRVVWKRRIKTVTKSKSLTPLSKATIAQELISCVGSNMHPHAYKAVEKLANYKSSILHRISLLFDNEYTFNSFKNDFWLKLRILSGNL